MSRNEENKKFVNDDFNWQNANSKVATIMNPDRIEMMKKRLTWLPEDSSDLFKINSMGYRSDEFIESRDLIFAGCSETWGDAVLEDGIWGNILSKKMGVKSYNLGASGKSVQFIVNNLLAFFKENGNPKFLFCLFPEFTRCEMKSDVSFMKNINVADKARGRMTYSVIKYFERDISKYSKAPHLAEEIIPDEFIFSITIDYIKYLETYCNLNNIFFRWGTWSKHEDNYLKNNIDHLDFKNYTYLGLSKWKHFSGDTPEDVGYFLKDKKECHEEVNIYGRNFYESMDLDIKNKKHGHMPIHTHIHIAEDFERSLNDNSN